MPKIDPNSIIDPNPRSVDVNSSQEFVDAARDAGHPVAEPAVPVAPEPEPEPDPALATLPPPPVEYAVGPPADVETAAGL